MSCNYAEGLSEYRDKGVCGLPEIRDSSEDVITKVTRLSELIKESNHVVFHTGAGISTSAGIPDFRGPKGVWTLEKNGEKPKMNVSFDDAIPTFTHMTLVALEQNNLLHYVVNQNVDGLSVKSAFPFEKLSELHGNMFVDKCQICERLYIRNSPSKTVGQKCTGVQCPLPKATKRSCRGKLYDTILDWEGELPIDDLELAELHSSQADLSICLGTTLQINPSGKLPLLTKKNGGKIVICNLQKTKYDGQADLVIHAEVDYVMEKLTELLGIKVECYNPDNDPTKFNFPVEFKRTKSLAYLNKCQLEKVKTKKLKKVKVKENEYSELKKIKLEDK